MTLDEAMNEYRTRSEGLVMIEELMKAYDSWLFAFKRNNSYTGKRKDLTRLSSEIAFDSYTRRIEQASRMFGCDSEFLKAKVRRLHAETQK